MIQYLLNYIYNNLYYLGLFKKKIYTANVSRIDLDFGHLVNLKTLYVWINGFLLLCDW